MENVIKIWCDGGCRNNQTRENIGAWAFRVPYPHGQIQQAEPVKNTTNNRMELTAVIKALQSVDSDLPIQIYLDSQYVLKGITEWIQGWKKNNWRTVNKKPIQNKELWLELDPLIQGKNISWIWVKGHSGNVGNEAVDELLNIAMNQAS